MVGRDKRAFTRASGCLTAASIEEAEHAFSEMSSAFRREIARRRVSPAEDFLSQLISATKNGADMTEEELIGQLLLLLPAGHESTTNTMALILFFYATQRFGRSF